MIQDVRRLRASAWLLFLAVFSWMACDGALPATGDTMVAAAGHVSAQRAASVDPDEAGGVAVAVVYSTNNDGEIEPCG